MNSPPRLADPRPALRALLRPALSPRARAPAASGRRTRVDGSQSAGARAAGQTQSKAPAESPDNVDNLFNQGAAIPKATVPTGTSAALAQEEQLHFFSSLNLYADAGFGYKKPPDPSDLTQYLGVEGGASFSANIGVEVRPAAEMRLRMAMEYDFPPAAGSQQPSLQIAEMFMDYTFLNSVFFRVGVFNYTWGNAQFYQLGDLPSRSLPGWANNLTPVWEKTNLITNTTEQDHPISLKAYVPFGSNGFTFIGRADLANYAFPNDSSPDPRYMGFGLSYDLLTGPIEWTMAGIHAVSAPPAHSPRRQDELFGIRPLRRGGGRLSCPPLLRILEHGCPLGRRPLRGRSSPAHLPLRSPGAGARLARRRHKDLRGIFLQWRARRLDLQLPGSTTRRVPGGTIRP